MSKQLPSFLTASDSEPRNIKWDVGADAIGADFSVKTVLAKLIAVIRGKENVG